MSEHVVTHSVTDGIFTITINRPDKLNALNAEVIQALSDAVSLAAADAATRVVVITGSGERAFVAGADIGELQQLEPGAARPFIDKGHELMGQIEKLGKPVIAAINGFALGGGCELALACTLRVAADNALLGLPEAKLGLIPGYGGTQRLSRIVGRGRALQMMLTGDPVNAEQALAMGLVTEVVDGNELADAVARLAGKLAKGAPLAMAAIISSVQNGADLPLVEGLELEARAFEAVAETQDMQEGTRAFLEKRKPSFNGN